MKLLVTISYYYPNISGLTIYVNVLAKELMKRGHDVLVLTSKHKKTLPSDEVIDSVKVKRNFVLFKMKKGVFMPFLPFKAWKHIQSVDMVNCHLPQFESFIYAIVGKLLGKKVVFTHHTDLSGWKGAVNRLSEAVLWCGQLIGSLFADKIVTYTKDYAQSSWFLKLFKSKLVFAYPPAEVYKIDSKLQKKWREKIGNPKYIIGYSGRFARQKGIPHLLSAIPYIKRSLNDFKIVFIGPYKNVVGEKYYEDIKGMVDKYSEDVEFLGSVHHKKISSFYSMCDVLVLPSDDRLESFGIVQVEAMLVGCPVVATALPGVRVPIKETGMGMLVEPGKSKKLADAVVKVVLNKDEHAKPKKKVAELFDFSKSIDKYELLFEV
jgi:glycosyltransferase involved in cell wall biosynthesis